MTISANTIDGIKTVQHLITLPTVGDLVTVVRGRNKNTQGIVFYANPNGKIHYAKRFGSSTEHSIADSCGASLRLGITKTDGVKIYVNYLDHVA